ncbi:MAG: ferrous iron transport protein A [Parachlamydiales bacterium]|nr:ferrous iron transport protein A [Parachlamydiales bacterium]
MLLSEVQKNQTVQIIEIMGGRELHTKLHSMGIVVGVKCVVVRNDCRFPLIVRIQNCRLVLGRGIAEKIEVQVV